MSILHNSSHIKWTHWQKADSNADNNTIPSSLFFISCQFWQTFPLPSSTVYGEAERESECFFESCVYNVIWLEQTIICERFHLWLTSHRANIRSAAPHFMASVISAFLTYIFYDAISTNILHAILNSAFSKTIIQKSKTIFTFLGLCFDFVLCLLHLYKTWLLLSAFTHNKVLITVCQKRQ